MFETPLATSWWSLLIGLYGYVLPGILYAAWVTIALWDLIGRESPTISFRARWMAVVLLAPFAGPLLYFAFGRSPIPSQLRLVLTVGRARGDAFGLRPRRVARWLGQGLRSHGAPPTGRSRRSAQRRSARHPATGIGAP